MIPPQIINVVCPNCKDAWMNISESGIEYFCFHCGFTLTEEQAKKAAWQTRSPYYGE
jgi:ribosomal protein S27E